MPPSFSGSQNRVLLRGTIKALAVHIASWLILGWQSPDREWRYHHNDPPSYHTKMNIAAGLPEEGQERSGFVVIVVT